MIRAWSVAAVRAAEDDVLARTPPGALMQTAAAGLAAVTARVLRERAGGVSGRRVVLLVGAGNNGGDALWAGARLAARGSRVDAVLVSAAAHEQGLAGLRRAGGRVHAVHDLPDADAALAAVADVLARAHVVLDGLVGLGGSPGLRQPAATLVAALPATAAVVAVDLPSGVDPDTGATPAAHVRADVTVTFGGAKPCLLLPPGDAAAGEVVTVDLGLPLGEPAVERLQPRDAGRLWPVPARSSDKYRRGVLGVVAGSQQYPGAAVLCVSGAVRAGAGMVRYVGPEHPAEQVRLRWPEVVAGEGRVQAWAVGSGVDARRHEGPDDGQRAHIEAALASGLPCVADAGALQVVADLVAGGGHLGAHVLLTPHAGELATLLTAVGDDVDRVRVEAEPVAHVRLAARRTGATVLLKGATTLVATPDGRLRSQAEATGWLATAGAGDVLAGICGTLLAAGLEPLDAGSVAAHVHGRAARAASGGGPLVAEDVAAQVPAVVRSLLDRPGR